MSWFKLRADFGSLAAPWRVGCHTFVDRCNGFYTFFILWLTGAMDSIKSAKIQSKNIKNIKKYKTNIKII